MKSSPILNVTFDCADSDRMSRFWSDVTGWPRAKVEIETTCVLPAEVAR